MALATGVRLGPYEIIAPLGTGGFGEVYKVRDTRLDRTVAMKILADGLAADSELRARFEREAKAIAALQHPHICPLHDVGRQDGTDYLVMEAQYTATVRCFPGRSLPDQRDAGGSDRCPDHADPELAGGLEEMTLAR